MNKGIYCLLFVTGGAGIIMKDGRELKLPPGYYIYIGSALGTGGLSRVKRHFRLSKKPLSQPPHWHVDTLLISPSFDLIAAFCSFTEERLECAFAGILGGESVPGFGCTDCRCPSHLFFRKDCPVNEIMNGMKKLSLTPLITTLK